MREDLPRGTVTFLFTDIAGSTRLLAELGPEAYAAALADHRAIVRAAATACGGVEVDTQGDAFFLAFPDASRAVDAAVAIAHGLEPGRIRLRMGLHTGTPLVTDEGYVGDDVHLAARLAAVAHGGQIVLSGATRGLLDGRHVTLDLGEHRLKDIGRAIAVHQAGTEPFPPLRSLANTNLPTPVSSFLGRAEEVDAIRDRILAGARLVTLTGPGGTGKTRLSIEAARRVQPDFGAGVWWVGLATITDPALVLPTIAGVLGTTDDVATHIGDRRMLLVLDNLEQVVAVAPRLAELLATCPGLALLVSSRIVLRIAGEVEIAVGGLEPKTAVELFTSRSGLDPSADAHELCRRLDTLPLAVELAASRARVLGTRSVLERLGSRLDLLKGGRDLDPRQQTLRSTIAWSEGLLEPGPRRLFRRLSVFVAGCTLDAAEAVLDADLDDLATLVEHSLVRATHERFWMLETIRTYAVDAFADDPDRPAIEREFTSWALDLLEHQDALLRGPQQLGALERLDRELDNIRAAFELALAAGEPDVARRFARAAGWFMRRRGLHVEARDWARRALDAPGNDLALLGWTIFEEATWDYGWASSPEAQAGMTRAQELGVETGDDRLVASVLEVRGFLEPGPGGPALMAQARDIYERLGLQDELGRVTINLAARLLNDGDPAGALTWATEGLERAYALGNRDGIGTSFANRAAALVLLGRPDEAADCVIEAAEAYRQIGEQYAMLFVLEIAAAIDVARGPRPLQAALLAAAEAGYVRMGISSEPIDARLDALVRETLDGLDPAVREAAADQGRRLAPADLFQRWLDERREGG